ncbi:MAG TPA: zinc-dependent alcohol dehydrogenase family protein [Dehalococcoidia bacterium]|nr:zinc-dependent alcohol dehydrogenase family protein [Dehalococcoidia bacterium]
MQAMVLREPRPIEEQPLVKTEVTDPVPGPGEIRLRVLACGVCHTDLHSVEGELPPHRLPLIPGHEIVGIVDRVGLGVSRYGEGDRVGVAWLHSACGQCRYCERGNENLCPQARFTGYDVDGGYAQYAIVPQDFAHPLPQGFSPVGAAPLLCAGIIGFRALRLSEIRPGGRLGLFGFGASAHIAIQVAIYWGCQVLVFTRSQEHRRLARELGAAWAGGAEDEPPARLDSAIIFAPAGRLVLDALRVLDKGGTLALAGIYMTPIPEMDYTQYLYHERTVRSVANSTRQDAQELLRLAAEIPLRTEVQVFPLDEANEALRLLKQGKIQGAAVLHISE